MLKKLLMLAALLAFIPMLKADDEEDKVKIAVARRNSTNNLKQIALGFHNYESAMAHCPNNIEDKNGKLLLSWRVAILPYIQQDKLYKEFKLDEAWDSDHNKKLAEKIPAIFEPTIGKAEKGETFYRGFTGKHTMFEKGKKVRFADITDGMSNTLLVVEAEKPSVWTKPDDLPFDPKKDELPKVGGTMFKNGYNAAFGDGSVRFIKIDIAKETLKALITRDGGEVISP